MRLFAATGQYKKDFKKAIKQGKDIEKLNAAIRCILEEKPLDARYRDHALTGNFKGRREFHVTPDWLVMYRIAGDQAIFERLGSHSELFG